MIVDIVAGTLKTIVLTVAHYLRGCYGVANEDFPRDLKIIRCGLNTQGAKSLYLAKKRLEVTSPAIVVLNAFLDSSDLPKEGLSGLLWKFFWRDALIRRYLDVLFVI